MQCTRGGLFAAVTHLDVNVDEWVSVRLRPSVPHLPRRPPPSGAFRAAFRLAPATSRLLPATSRLLPATCRLPLTAFRLPPTTCRLLPVTCYAPPVPRCWPPRCLRRVALPLDCCMSAGAASAGLKRARRCWSRPPGACAIPSFPTWSANPCGGTHVGAGHSSFGLPVVFRVVGGRGRVLTRRVHRPDPSRVSVAGGWSWRLGLALDALCLMRLAHTLEAVLMPVVSAHGSPVPSGPTCPHAGEGPRPCLCLPPDSPWLKSVKVDATDASVSRWTLAARGVQVSWQARNTSVIAGELIAWQSMDGLSNRGSVKFEDVPPAPAVAAAAAAAGGPPATRPADVTAVTLSVAFDVPAPIARVLDNAVIGKYVEQTLLADLRRYRTEVLKEVRGAARAGAARAR